MKNRLLNYYLFLLLVVFLTGCEENEKTFIPQPYKVVGTVEKGPFVRGSKITAQAMDGSFNLTGDVYQGIILDNDGSFDLGEVILASPYVLLSTDGYYFNEVTGELSKGQITMQSLVNLSDNNKANVNVFTHLKTQRMMHLLKNGSLSFDEADRQVQKEVLKEFGFERYADKDVCNFSIASGTDEAAALIVVSSVLLYGNTDAELTEMLALLGAEFKANGNFREKTQVWYRETAMRLDLKLIESNIIKRYKELGMNITVPDLNYAIDWDNDGIAGNEPDAGSDYALSLEPNTLVVPTEGGTFRVKINCKLPVTFQNPGGTSGETTLETLKMFVSDDMNFTKIIEGKELVITVAPATERLMSGISVPVYTTNGKLTAKLGLTQKGDESKPLKISAEGQMMMADGAMKLSEALPAYCNLDGYYTCCFDGNQTPFRNIYNHSFGYSEPILSTIWDKSYNFINWVSYTKRLIEHQELAGTESIIHCLNQLSAMMHLQLVSWWENIVYVEDYNNPEESIRQLNSDRIFEIFTGDILYCAENRPSGNNDPNTFDGFLYPSREVSYALLGKMYLHGKTYARAYDYLKRIIDSGVYALDASAATAIKKGSRELVYGTLLGSGQRTPYDVLQNNDYTPFITYTEVLLSAAECAFRLGRQAEAVDYLNQVARARNLPLLVSDSNFQESLHAVWQSELKGFGSYFAFLRRNDMAKNLLGIQEYQQLMPIPYSALHNFRYMVQNPGW